MNLGFSEIFMVFLVALLVFGPDKLPDLARMVGRAVREFRKASAELHFTVRDTFENLEEGRSPEVPLRDLAQKYDPRALIQEAISRPFAEDMSGKPPAVPADARDLGLVSPPGEPMGGDVEVGHAPASSMSVEVPPAPDSTGRAPGPIAERLASLAAPESSVGVPREGAGAAEQEKPDRN